MTKTKTIRFSRLCDGVYVTDNFGVFLEKVDGMWVVTEQGNWKHQSASLSQAKAWARRFINGETICGRA